MNAAREDYHDVGTIDREDALASISFRRQSCFPRPIGDTARRGLLGDFLALVEPHTESDPAALLVQWLVAFGSALGRGPHFITDGATQHCNLFAVLVAPSSKGRKGTSWSHVRNQMQVAAPGWQPQSGLASGEGLIYHVRDPLFVRKQVKKRGRPTGEYEQHLQEDGVADKRLCVVEPEFARVLKASSREGSTLSAVIREAWDTGTLSSLTRNSPLKATGAHVSVIGHITAEELRRELNSSDAANGFGNRFLWVCSRRSKELPDGGAPDLDALHRLSDELRYAISHGRERGRLLRSASARDLWHAAYSGLSAGHPGLIGSVTGRAEAQVVRLSLLYALMDCAPEIDAEHLEAAFEVWRYCHESAAYVFGSSLGNRHADNLLSALRRAGPEGLSRTKICEVVFRRNVDQTDIEAALVCLLEHNLARFHEDCRGPGRPVQRWYAVEQTR